MVLRKKSEGFTLIELLVVIAIIGVLAAVVLLAINPVRMLRKGRDAQRMSDLDTLRRVINLTMVQNVSPYVPGFDLSLPTIPPVRPLDQISNCTPGVGGNCCTASNAAASGWLAPADGTNCPNSPFPVWAIDMSQNLSKIPVDPTNSGTYHYRYQSNAAGDKFSLTAKLENLPSPTNCYQTGTYIPASFCWGP